ncbi:hypothetical protein S245_064168 [Arachis hypogaea]
MRCKYRDRVAERRNLHGGFGVGYGQKNSEGSYIETPSSPGASCTQEAASEALEMSFGFGSYARKLLKIQKHGLKAGMFLPSTNVFNLLMAFICFGLSHSRFT